MKSTLHIVLVTIGGIRKMIYLDWKTVETSQPWKKTRGEMDGLT
jgi:hypothetical protein